MKNHNEYNGGIADCWYSGGVSDLWVEYKYLEVPKRPSTPIVLTDVKKPYALSTLQQEWLRHRHEEGRAVGVIVGSKDGGVWLPGVKFETPLTAEQFNHALKPRKHLAELIAGMTHG